MFPFEDRFTRQRQLPEVGLMGQQRLAEASVWVLPDAAGVVEATYLRRAGIGKVEQLEQVVQLVQVVQPEQLERRAPCPIPDFVHAGEFSDPAAQEFAEGAWRACRQVCLVLEISARERRLKVERLKVEGP